MKLRILTPTGLVLETDCSEVLIPAAGGALGIRGGHTELVVPLIAGQLLAKTANNEEVRYMLTAGSAEITAKILTVLVESALLN